MKDIKKINWKYTLGEVIIVVIGIYIAFSLNSLKENLSNSKHKTPYLKNIMMSIEGSYYLIIGGNKKCIESNNVLLKNINNELSN